MIIDFFTKKEVKFDYTCDSCKYNIGNRIEDDKLSDRCLGQIRDDIKEAKYLGMQCDEVQWIKLLKKIEEVI